MSNEIKVAIYDLSMGMASTLSAQFLGPDHAIPLLPHTAIIAYGYEYFFGGDGIHRASPHAFRAQSGLQPVQIVDVGRTSKSQTDFERWCYNNNPEFYPGSYDLFRRNCNNFSDVAARFLTGRGIPPWIIEVPDKVIASPVGRMFYQNMFGGGEGRFESIGAPPTAAMGGGNANPWSSVPVATNATTTTTTTSQPSPDVNPWANTVPSTPAATTPFPPATTHLDTHDKLLLSTSTAPIPLSIKKLRSHHPSNPSNELASLETSLSSNATPLATSTVRQALDPFMTTEDTSLALYVLILLRSIVLHPTNDGGNDDDDIIQSYVQLTSSRLQEGAFTTPRLRSMAWCVLSNAISRPEYLDRDAFVDNPQAIVDVALADLSLPSSPSELRQSAVALLHNIIHFSSQGGDLLDGTTVPDWIVTLLLSVMEDIDAEKDDVVLLRRVLIIGKIIKWSGARELMKDLGFNEILEGLKTKSGTVGEMIKEIVSMLT